MNPIHLRHATPDDAARLAALGMLVWLHTYAIDGVRDSIADYVLARFTRTAKQALLSDTGAQLIVAERDGQLLAYATLRLGRTCPGNHTANVELDTLYVHPLFARQGVGRALLQRARAEAAAPLWLSVWEHNDRALAFYRQQGLRECGQSWFELDGERHRNLLLALD